MILLEVFDVSYLEIHNVRTSTKFTDYSDDLRSFVCVRKFLGRNVVGAEESSTDVLNLTSGSKELINLVDVSRTDSSTSNRAQ